MTYICMAYIVPAYMFMVYIVIGCISMAYIVLVYRSGGLDSGMTMWLDISTYISIQAVNIQAMII